MLIKATAGTASRGSDLKHSICIQIGAPRFMIAQSRYNRWCLKMVVKLKLCASISAPGKRMRNSKAWERHSKTVKESSIGAGGGGGGKH